MQLEFLELSPHLFVQNGQITAGLEYLCWAVSAFSLNGPLSPFPCRDEDVEVAEVSRRVATIWELWRQRSRCCPSGAWSQTWGLFTLLLWGFFSTGTCAIRIQCFGNIRDPWDRRSAASFRARESHDTCRLKFEYTSKSVSLLLLSDAPNVKCSQDNLGGIRWYIPL